MSQKGDRVYEKILPQRLTQLRTEKGVSSRDMSLSLGQNHGYIQSIENGKSFPSMSVFFYICEYLGITPQEFFDTGIESPARPNALLEDLKRLNTSQLDAVSTVVKEFLKQE